MLTLRFVSGDRRGFELNIFALRKRVPLKNLILKLSIKDISRLQHDGSFGTLLTFKLDRQILLA